MTLDELLNRYGELMHEAGQVKGELKVMMRMSDTFRHLPEQEPGKDVRIEINMPKIEPKEKKKLRKHMNTSRTGKNGQRYTIINPRPAILDAIEGFDGPISSTMIKRAFAPIYKERYGAPDPITRSSFAKAMADLARGGKIRRVEHSIYEKINTNAATGG